MKQTAPDIEPAAVFRRLPLNALIIAAAAIYAITCFKVTQLSSLNFLTPVWPGTSWIAACLALLPNDRARIQLIAFSVLFDGIGNSINYSATFSAVAAPINIVAPVLCWLLARRFCGRGFCFDDNDGLLRFVIVATGVALTSATLGLIPNAMLPEPYATGESFKMWFLAETLGLWALYPALLLLMRKQPDIRFTGTFAEALLMPAVVCAATAWILQTGHYPLLFVIIPLLCVIAFRLGPAHSAASTLLLCVVAIATTNLSPSTPIVGVEGVVSATQFIQLFIAVASLTALIAAIAVMQQLMLNERLGVAQAEAETLMREAQAASAAKSEFVATMSHELRSPLNGIIGFSQIVLGRPDLDEDVRREIGIIKRAGKSLLAVVNDVLDYSALEERRVQITPKALVLAEVVPEAALMIDARARENKLQLNHSIDADLSALTLVGDGERIRQVLVNLLTNAVKYTDAGQIDLRVRKGRRQRVDTIDVRFEVSDTGIGIDSADIAHIFERYNRPTKGRVAAPDSSGLGLSICRRLVHAMHGEIGVTSTLGKGSTFWFEIPMQTAVAVPRADRTPHVASKARLLVVDDLPLNRDVAAALLKRAGYGVETVDGGAEAIAAVGAGGFDLVLMDVQMPDIDGHAATREIRQGGGRFAQVPIIAMTANTRPEDISRCLAAGMDGVIGKPLDRDNLVSTIEAHLAQGRGVAASSPAREQC